MAFRPHHRRQAKPPPPCVPIAAASPVRATARRCSPLLAARAAGCCVGAASCSGAWCGVHALRCRHREAIQGEIRDAVRKRDRVLRSHRRPASSLSASTVFREAPKRRSWLASCRPSPLALTLTRTCCSALAACSPSGSRSGAQSGKQGRIR